MLPDVRKKTAALLVAAVFLLCGCGKAYAFVIRKDTIKVQIINAPGRSGSFCFRLHSDVPVLLKHQKGPILLIVCRVAACENDAIKQINPRRKYK